MHKLISPLLLFKCDVKSERAMAYQQGVSKYCVISTNPLSSRCCYQQSPSSHCCYQPIKMSHKPNVNVNITHTCNTNDHSIQNGTVLNTRPSLSQQQHTNTQLAGMLYIVWSIKKAQANHSSAKPQRGGAMQMRGRSHANWCTEPASGSPRRSLDAWAHCTWTAPWVGRVVHSSALCPCPRSAQRGQSSV